MGKAKRNQLCRAAKSKEECEKMDSCTWDLGALIRCSEEDGPQESVVALELANLKAQLSTLKIGYCPPAETAWDHVKEGSIGGLIGFLLESVLFVAVLASKKMKKKFGRLLMRELNGLEEVLAAVDREEPEAVSTKP